MVRVRGQRFGRDERPDRVRFSNEKEKRFAHHLDGASEGQPPRSLQALRAHLRGMEIPSAPLSQTRTMASIGSGSRIPLLQAARGPRVAPTVWICAEIAPVIFGAPFL